jgi:diguanylate cyclase (GGDEF)-like protein/PAS domain S-box-containing protein
MRVCGGSGWGPRKPLRGTRNGGWRQRGGHYDLIPSANTPMLHEARTALQAFRADASFIYEDTGVEAGRLRAALLSAVLRLTPLVMVANVGCALVILWAFGGYTLLGMEVWLALMAVVAAAALRGWWRGRHGARETASCRAVQRATLHAGALAALWAVVPLVWFPGAAPHQQVQIAMVVTGMMGAGTFVLNPLPRACLAYVGIYSAGAVGALLIEGNRAHAGVGLMIALYALVLAAGALAAGHKHLALLRSQAEMARQQRMLELLLHDFEQNADEALWQTDLQGRISHASPRLAQLLGLANDGLIGQPLLQLLELQAGANSAQLKSLGSALAEAQRLRDLPLELQVAGQARHLVLRGQRVIGEDGQAQGWRGVLADVTERVLGQQRLHQMAHTDFLTGLANRLTLRDALGESLRRGSCGALLLLDLDDFKGVNDSLGHTAGDELLCGVAQRLRQCLRPGDLVARLGGDEFAVLMQHDARLEDAQALATRLIGTVALPFELRGRHLRIGSSVGVAVYGEPAADVNPRLGQGLERGLERVVVAGPLLERELTLDPVFVQADMALYAAKEAGRGRHVVYAPLLGERSQRRLEIERGLGQALARGELSLAWQPIVDIASWRIVGAEALLRWHSPVLGAVGPAEFIGVAERCGLINELGHFALTRACAEAAAQLGGLTISVNVSPLQLQEEAFVDLLRAVLQQSGLPAARLQLELTENFLIDDVHGALRRLHALRGLGVRVALDDFGTGYSSLAYLRRFPFDSLKIDRSFVNEALESAQTRAIVHTISRLAATLRMRTVCEGVETSAQLAAVVEAGCDQMQGYLASPPLPLAQFSALLRQWPTQRPSTELAAPLQRDSQPAC